MTHSLNSTLRCALPILAGCAAFAAGGSYTLIGWNDLGMHCMDGDYTVFSILPPYNTIHAQLVDPSGKLVKSGAGITVTYQAVADPAGSVNSTSAGKTNFWQYVEALFGAAPAVDTGLAGSAMPGKANQPQAMAFDAGASWFTATGVPLTPFDDAGNKNPYPMMRLVARDASGKELAHTDIVLPVSDEMDCRACHSSGSGDAARPRAGWVFASPIERDYKLNILRLHDDRQALSPAYATALVATGYNKAGLYASVVNDAKPVLCAACHASAVLSAAGQPGIPPLTTSLHGYHASVADSSTGVALDDQTSRAACYRCHPGALTRCLRGAMGTAVAADGTLAIQCQDCHGSMSVVGTPGRQGWLEEPNCQSCHTGTATQNAGQMRFTSAFNSAGRPRPAMSTVFATNPNTPGPGLSLYRFSAGHGGLACEACHGSTHAEYPSSHANDNVQSVALQGATGKLGDCSVCHLNMRSTNGGPHGMHTTGAQWIRDHPNAAERGATACQDCHGTDYRGTLLSQALGVTKILTSQFATLQTWQGFQIGCYSCHNGPRGEGGAGPRAASVSNATASTATATPVTIPLAATGGTLRVVSQPHNGTVALNGSLATYTPFAGFEGPDTFTFAAWNGSVDSNLGTATVQVNAASRPVFQAAGVLNAASFQGGPIAPGELLAIFGAGMGPAALAPMEINSAGLVSRLLAGTRVLFDGAPAPVVYTLDNQLSAIAPFSIAGKTATAVRVEYQGIQSDPVTVPVSTAAPGIFSTQATGQGQGAVLNQDYTLNTAANPAARGSVVMIYGTGAGAMDPAVLDGQLVGDVLPKPVRAVTVQIGGTDATVVYAGAAPGMATGLIQVNAQVPDGVTPGPSVPVTIKVGNAASQPGITLAVK